MRGLVISGSKTCRCHLGKVIEIYGESSPDYWRCSIDECEHFNPSVHIPGTFKKAYVKILPDEGDIRDLDQIKELETS